MTNLGKSALLAALVACGGGGGSGAGGGAVSVDDFPMAFSDATCAYTFRCCTDAEIMQEFADFTIGGQPVTTEAQCEEAFTGLLSLVSTDWNKSISEGRVSYDPNAAGACLSLLDSISCGETPPGTLSDSCGQFLVPLVQGSGACLQSYECVEGLCVGAQIGSDTSQDGACAPRPGLGQACEGECGSGLYCDFADEGSAGPECAMKLGEGAACEESSDCESDSCVGSDTAKTCGAMTCTGR